MMPLKGSLNDGAPMAQRHADYRWGAVTDRILEVYRGVLR